MGGDVREGRYIHRGVRHEKQQALIPREALPLQVAPTLYVTQRARTGVWWSVLLDYRTAILEAHATSGRARPAERVKSQWLAGDA